MLTLLFWFIAAPTAVGCAVEGMEHKHRMERLYPAAPSAAPAPIVKEPKPKPTGLERYLPLFTFVFIVGVIAEVFLH